MGMGLLSHALTGAAAGAANGGIYVLKQQMEEEKTKRIAEYNSQLRRGDKEWELKTIDERKAADNEKIESAQTGLINQRFAPADEGMAAAERGETVAPLTDAQKSSIQMAKDEAGRDPSLYRDAVRQAGVLDPKEVLAVDRQASQDARQEKRDDAADSRWQQEYDLRIKQYRQSMANGDLSRREAQIRLDNLERQNDPQARSLLAQGAKAMAEGKREDAVKAFSVAASHYGNTEAMNQLMRLSPAELSVKEMGTLANTFTDAAKNLEMVAPDDAKRYATFGSQLMDKMQAKMNGGPGQKMRDAAITDGFPLTPGRYKDGHSLYKDGKEYVVRGDKAFLKK